MVGVPRGKVEGTFNFAHRSHLSCVSLSMDNEEAHKEFHDPTLEEGRVPKSVEVNQRYQGEPSNTSLLIYYFDHVARHLSTGHVYLLLHFYIKKIYA